MQAAWQKKRSVRVKSSQFLHSAQRPVLLLPVVAVACVASYCASGGHMAVGLGGAAGQLLG